MTVETGRRLAVFDLDGTLTRGDTFVGFVAAALARWPARLLRLPLLVLPLFGFVLGRLDRGGTKGAILHALFAGLRRTVELRLAPESVQLVDWRQVAGLVA